MWGALTTSCIVRPRPAILAACVPSAYYQVMSTLAEIEEAADALPPEEKQELMFFLATRLRAQGAQLPEPRKFTRDRIQAWIAEDEADLRRLKLRR